MSDPIQDLLQHRSSTKVDQHALAAMGKQATDLWQSGCAKDLSDAVLQTVKKASLNAEQVKRVVEFTNIDAFNREFKKEGSPNRVVHFDGGPADSAFILQELNSSRPVRVDHHSSDYDLPPQEKRASSLVDERLLDEHFKSSGLGYPEVDPFGDVMRLKDKLAGKHAEMTAELSELELGYQETFDRLFHQVKQASLAGHSLSEVVHIWCDVAPDPIFAKTAMSHMIPKLLDNRVLDDSGLVDSLQKFASPRAVNPSHPLVTEFKDYCATLSKLAALREERQEVADAVGKLTFFIKQAFTAKGLGGLADKAMHAAGTVGETGAKLLHGSEVTPNQLKWGGRAGKAALLGAGALGANEAYRHTLKYNPTFQQGAQFVREAIPGTQDYYNKEYRLMAGGQ